MPFYTNERKNGNFKCICDYCGKEFWRTTRQLCKMGKRKSTMIFCNNICSGYYRNTKEKVECKNCGIYFNKRQLEIIRSDTHFCSRSCAGTYNVAHKTYGTRRSKLEIWLETQLSSLYPNIEMHFNKKDVIKSELDIYIPSLNLAFELNGIFHYEPIFGKDKLNKIQENDENKYKKCLDNEIDLCIIDTTSQKRFTEKSSQKFLDIIVNIINER